jgi:hypothetical protein
MDRAFLLREIMEALVCGISNYSRFIDFVYCADKTGHFDISQRDTIIFSMDNLVMAK